MKSEDVFKKNANTGFLEKIRKNLKKFEKNVQKRFKKIISCTSSMCASV